MSFLIVKSFLSIFSYSMDAILQSFPLDGSLGFAGQARPDHIKKFGENLQKHAKGVSNAGSSDSPKPE